MGSLGVQMMISIITTAVVLIIGTRMAIIPVISAVIDTKLKDTNDMLKAAASSLGIKSGSARQLKKLETLMTQDIMKEFPELELALEYFSPETADYIKKHPGAALILLQRYAPFIEKYIGQQKGDSDFKWDF